MQSVSILVCEIHYLKIMHFKIEKDLYRKITIKTFLLILQLDVSSFTNNSPGYSRAIVIGKVRCLNVSMHMC